jgi:hypothetical protein
MFSRSWTVARATAMGALFTLAAASAACAQTREAAPFQWSGTIGPGGTVEIKSVNGPIQAVPSTGNTVRVHATRKGRRSNPDDVRIEVVEHRGGVTLCAVYPEDGGGRNECRPGSEGRLGARNNDVQVAFVVEVPASANFTGRTSNGAVSADNLSGWVEAYSSNGPIRVIGGSGGTIRTTNGSVEVRTSGPANVATTNGRIQARFDRVEGDAPLSLTTTNGSITLGLPANIGARVEARTTNGSIHSDLPITVQGQIGRRQQLTGTLGGGGREIQIRTTNGSIRLERGG